MRTNTSPSTIHTGQLLSQGSTLAAAATTIVDFNTGNNQTVTVGVNITTLTLNNTQGRARYLLEFQFSGAYTITWPSSFDWGAVGAPTGYGVAGKTMLVALYVSPTNAKIHAQSSKGHTT